MLDGIKNFLEFVNSNWTTIIIIMGLCIVIARKAKNYFSKSTDEKIEIAKCQIREIMLKLITDAELDYEEWDKAGSIKRAQVIQEIYAQYPILSSIVDQQAVLAWIDDVIDDALKTMRDVFEQNKSVLKNVK